MKKNTKKAGPGRKKQKVQISVRIDQEVMDLAYVHIQQTGRRITDLIERGLILAMREEGRDAPVKGRARFLLEQVPFALQRRIVRFSALHDLPKVRDLSVLEQCARNYVMTVVDTMETVEGYEASLQQLGLLPQLEA